MIRDELNELRKKYLILQAENKELKDINLELIREIKAWREKARQNKAEWLIDLIAKAITKIKK